ncbi:MAG: hypothetical protein ACRDJW_08710 [Thermomicrobiales bacterium]
MTQREGNLPPAFVLFTDDSAESEAAKRALDEAGVPYEEFREGPKGTQEATTIPYLVTPVGPYIGLESIESLTKSDITSLAQPVPVRDR